jgi:hypothetical protein
MAFLQERSLKMILANSKKRNYWADTRPIPLTAFEDRDYRKKDAFEEYKKPKIPTSIHFSIIKTVSIIPAYLIFGYAASNKSNRDSLYIFPFIQTFYYNTVEGLALTPR